MLLGALVAVRELVVFVVRVDDVLNDGARLPQRDTRVRVFDRWNTSVGVDALVRIFLHVSVFNHWCGYVSCAAQEKTMLVLRHTLHVVRHTELLKDDSDFPRVGTLWNL